MKNNAYPSSKHIPSLKRKMHFRQKGFTIIEFIVYMGLFSIFITVLTQLFVTSIDNQLSSQSTSGIDQDSTYIFLHFQHFVQDAKAVTSPSSYGVPSQTLTITDTTGTNYTYSLQNGNLIRTNNSTGTSDQLNSWDTQLTNISFTRVGHAGSKDSVQLAFTLQSDITTHSGNEQKAFQTTIGLRGY